MTHGLRVHRRCVCHFNPHEREARDAYECYSCVISIILIHTSVKLVTTSRLNTSIAFAYFNPHEREARDAWVACTS